MAGTKNRDEEDWRQLFHELLGHGQENTAALHQDVPDPGTKLLKTGVKLGLASLRVHLGKASSKELEEKFNLPRRLLLRMVDRADRDGDRQIDETEWMAMLHHETPALVSKPFQVLISSPHYSCNPPALVILGLSLIQVGFYLYHSSVLSSLGYDSMPATRAPICSLLIYSPVRRAQAWRFLTYQFTHVGLQHVAFNVLMQLFVGLPLEMSQLGWTGTLRVLTVYMAGVFFGSLGGSLPNPQNFVAGASAGVYALIAAHLATLVLNWKEDGQIYSSRRTQGRDVSLSMAPLVRWVRLVAVLAFTLLDVSLAVYNYYTGVDVSTGYMGHFCGALSGLLVGLVVLENRRAEVWEWWLKVSSISVYFVLLTAAMAWHTAGSYTHFFPISENKTSCTYPGFYSSEDQTHW